MLQSFPGWLQSTGQGRRKGPPGVAGGTESGLRGLGDMEGFFGGRLRVDIPVRGVASVVK